MRTNVGLLGRVLRKGGGIFTYSKQMPEIETIEREGGRVATIYLNYLVIFYYLTNT